MIARGSDGAVCIEDVSGVGLLVNGEVLTGGTRRLRGGDRISIAGRHMFVTDGTEGLMPTVGRRGAAPDPRPPQAPGAPPARCPTAVAGCRAVSARSSTSRRLTPTATVEPVAVGG